MREMTVASVMTKKVVTARGNTPFKHLVELMNRHGISGLPVVDRAGRPIGVVSEADTLAKQEYHGGTAPRPWFAGRARWARWHKAAGLTAADLMTTPAVTITDGDTVTAAARQFAAKRIRRLCVVNVRGELTGIVTRRDIIGTFSRPDDDIRDYELDDTASTAP
jgi:CBS domain-containing protein